MLNSLKIGFNIFDSSSVTSSKFPVQESQAKQPWPGINTFLYGQWSHFSPITPGKQLHWPVVVLHDTPTEYPMLHSQEVHPSDP